MEFTEQELKSFAWYGGYGLGFPMPGPKSLRAWLELWRRWLVLQPVTTFNSSLIATAHAGSVPEVDTPAGAILWCEFLCEFPERLSAWREFERQ